MLHLLFVECDCLFLRHAASGNCTTRSEELVYDIPEKAFPYFVVMTDNCLDHKAQFLYLNNTELLHNIEKRGTLLSTRGDFKSRFAVFKGVAEQPLKTEKNPRFNLKQTTDGYLMQDNKCAEPGTKYLNRKSCGSTNQQFTFGK